MSSVLRIIDANSNRAREALRVMEEAARFVLDDAELSRQIKQLRHDLARALALVPGVEANRDTPGDVGTAIKTEAEQRRASIAEVAIAAGKRLSEALRAIEEYAKTLPGSARQLAQATEGLRYRGYTIEQQLNRALGSGRRRQWRLCVLITESICREGQWWPVAQAAVKAGADCLQLREKHLDGGELLERARRLAQLCHEHGASLIVNDRPDIALLAGADGVHVGQTDLPCAEVRRLVGAQLLVGVSTSHLEQAKQALRDGADYCGVGPMFASSTKHKPVIVGRRYLQEYLAWDGLPHLAIGGIEPGNVDELVEAGVRGIAVSRAVCAATDPAASVGQLLERVGLMA